MKILSTQLKNRLVEICDGLNLQINLKNIRTNGPAVGCSGYIKNLDNDVSIYVNTEPTTVGHPVYRYEDPAAHFTGCNQFSSRQLEGLIVDLKSALKNTYRYNAERVRFTK